MLPTDGGPHIQEYVPAIEGTRNDTEGEVLALRPALPPLRNPALSNRRLLTAGRWPVIGNGNAAALPFRSPAPASVSRGHVRARCSWLFAGISHLDQASEAGRERGIYYEGHLVRDAHRQTCHSYLETQWNGPFIFYFFKGNPARRRETEEKETFLAQDPAAALINAHF